MLGKQTQVTVLLLILCVRTVICLSWGPRNLIFLSCVCIAHCTYLLSRCGLYIFRFSLYNFPTSSSGFLLIATTIESLYAAEYSSGLLFFYTEAALHCSGNEKGPQWEQDSRPSWLALYFMTYQIDCTRTDKIGWFVFLKARISITISLFVCLFID